MPHLSLCLLGPFQATLDGQPITDFKSIKVRALLAYLAVEADRPHSRETLAGLLWPDYADRAALDNLRYTLSDLRGSIGDRHATPPFLRITRDTLQFNPDSDFNLDVKVFQQHIADRSDPIDRLHAAIELYCGRFLDGFSIGDSAPFEEWALLKREQLEQQMLAALHALAAFYEQGGDYQQAEPYVRRQLDLAPWDEEAHRQLMRLLAFTDRASAALAQYDIGRRHLIDELGIEPSASLTALYESIRDGKLIAPTRTIGAFQSIDQPEVRIQPIVVARDTELARLDRSLAAALAGHGQIVFVTGEPGSGKTVLMQEFARRAMTAHYDLITIQGRCGAHAGAGDPYLPVLEALRMLAGDIEAQRAGGAITREHARRLWTALPDVAQALIEHGSDLIDRFVPGVALIGHAEVAAPDRAAHLQTALNRLAAAPPRTLQQLDLFTQYARVLKTVAWRNPMMLIIDDLQWADAGSISLLFHLARQLAGGRLLLIGAYRSGDVAQDRLGDRHPLSPVINELQREFGDIQIDLNRAEGSNFVNQLLDSEPNQLGAAFHETLYRHTGGQPLFTVELLRGLQERGDLIRDEAGRWREGSNLNWGMLPARVEAVIAERIARLPGEWQRLLTIASVEGEEFTAEVIARVQGADESAVLQHLSGELSKQQRLVNTHSLRRLEGQRLSRYRFRHRLFQKFLYSRLDQIERARLHEAVGSTLESMYGALAEEIAVPLAWHFERAGLTAKAVDYLLQAGHQAVHLFAYDEAILHFQRGIQLLTGQADTSERNRLELQLQMALAAPIITAQGYTSPDLERAYTRAHQLVDRIGNGQDLFQVLSILKSYYNLRGDPINSRDTARRLLETAEQSHDTSRLMTAHSRLASNALYYGQWADLRDHLAQTIRFYDPVRHRALVYQLGSDPMGVALEYASMGFWIMGYPDQARQYCRDSLAQAQELAHPLSSWFAFFYAAWFHVYAREIQEAEWWIDAALRLCDEQNLAHYRAYAECIRGWVRAQKRDAEGIAALERGVTWLKDIGDRMNLYSYLWLLADACYLHARYSQADEAAEEALALSQATEMIFLVPELLRLKGEITLAHASWDSTVAKDFFLRAITAASAQEARMWELRATLSLCRLLQQQGERDEARRRLAHIYDWFTEGFETSDLKEAKALLCEYGATLPS